MKLLATLKRIPTTAVLLALASLASTSPILADSSEAAPRAASTSIEWSLGSAERAVVTVSHPSGHVTRHEFEPGQTPRFEAFDSQGNSLADGVYTYEVVGGPAPRPNLRKRMEAAKSPDAAAEIAASAPKGYVRSGTFQVRNGMISLPQPGAGRQDQASAREDQVIPDDLIVQGSGCFGFDCVNNESFGFDTIRMKENNTRIKFDDTSVGTFPANDWQLTANDSASGGASKFSIEDITGARVPFTITAGAATNALFIDSSARLGLKTSTPVLDIHINTSNTPAIRMEQNNSGGFTAQTWDIAGNEANWFVRDVTGGSRLPFRIRPGAPTSSVDIAADGDVGIGTASPAAALHVSRSSGATLEGIALRNNNEARITIENTNVSAKYITAVNNTGTGIYFISREGGGGTILEVAGRNDAGGIASVKVTGSVQATNVIFSSSRELKENFEPVSGEAVLDKVAALPITQWNYKEGTHTRHIGPMAEDFHALFGLDPNGDGATISVTDSSGVALAAIQGLLSRLTAVQAENDALNARLQALERVILANSQP